MSLSNPRCWCCGAMLGTCQCQDEITGICPACMNCEAHCCCIQTKPTGITECSVCHGEGKHESWCNMPLVEGIGPNAPTVINAKGGKQSASPYRCDLLPPKALLQIAKILKQGADKYGDNNWRDIGRVDHINHAMAHICAFGCGDDSDDHLGHAATRLLFALETK